MGGGIISFDQKCTQPNFLSDGFSTIKRGVRSLTNTVKDLKPCMNSLKVAQFTVKTLSCMPKLKQGLKPVENVLKECKDVSNFLKGIRSIDGLLNFKNDLKFITLNISGATLFVLSSLTIADKLKLINITPVKVALTALPVIGILPFGGILHLSLLGMFGVLFLWSLASKNKVDLQAAKCNDKITYWTTLDADKIKKRQEKYQKKIANLNNEIESLGQLAQDGELRKQSLSKNDSKKLATYERVLDEIKSQIGEKKAERYKWIVKDRQWELLKSQIPTSDNTQFYQARQDKWRAKLQQRGIEGKIAVLDITDNGLSILTTAVYVGVMLTGYGVALNFVIDIGAGIVGCGCAIGELYFQRSLHKSEQNLDRTRVSSQLCLPNN